MLLHAQTRCLQDEQAPENDPWGFGAICCVRHTAQSPNRTLETRELLTGRSTGLTGTAVSMPLTRRAVGPVDLLCAARAAACSALFSAVVVTPGRPGWDGYKLPKPHSFCCAS